MPRKYPPFEFGPTGQEANAGFKDYEAVGKKLLEWSQKGPSSWPKTIDDLRNALAGHLMIPPQVKRLKVVQSDDSFDDDYEFILRLPARGQVTESNKLAKLGTYDLPPVVTMLAAGLDGAEVLTRERMFHARVADYTMRQCR